MLINLSDILSINEKTKTVQAELDMQAFESRIGIFPIIEKHPVALTITHVKERKLLIKGKTDLKLEIPCDRCLSIVPTEFKIEFDKDVNFDETEDEVEEKNYIDGYNLDVDKLLYNEILIGWPMKVLCSEDCKGVCGICGQNLNEGACDCEDTSLDPRMSVIRDVFKNFKEV